MNMHVFSQFFNPVDEINQMNETVKAGNDLIKSFIERGKYQAPINTPTTPVFDVGYWSKFIADIIKSSLWLLWNSFVDISFFICIIIAVAGICLYVFGYKKGIRYTGGSIGFYIVIKFLTLALTRV